MDTSESRCFNCQACGYPTCKDMAVAIHRGLNIPDNCIVYAKNNLKNKHDSMLAMANKCRELSDNLVRDIDSIINNTKNINDAAGVTSEKSNAVRQLLSNLVMYYDANKEHIDTDAIARIIAMIQIVIDAFDHLDKSVAITNKSSVDINNSVSELTRLVEELNVMLHETTGIDKY